VCCQEPTLESESPEFQSSAIIITSHCFCQEAAKKFGSIIDVIFVLACAIPVYRLIAVCAFGGFHRPYRCKGKSCAVFALSQFLPRGNICLLRQRIWGWDDAVIFFPLSLFFSLLCSEGSPSHSQVCLLGQRNQEKKLESVGETLGRREYFCGTYIYLIVELLGQHLDPSYGFT